MSYVITSLGTFKIKNNDGNHHPVVIVAGKENLVEIPEMILWSTAMFTMYDRDKLETVFHQKCQQAGLTPQNYGKWLLNCVKRGLMVCGNDKEDSPALEQIIFNVTAHPVPNGILAKSFVFLKLLLTNKAPYNIAKRVFQKPELTETEQLVLDFIKTSNDTVWTIFLEKSVTSKDDFVIDTANLYLKKEIYFDAI